LIVTFGPSAASVGTAAPLGDGAPDAAAVGAAVGALVAAGVAALLHAASTTANAPMAMVRKRKDTVLPPALTPRPR
jgi:hypothetical protein